MLFSEPKIPQSPADTIASAVLQPFSALQRAENSSMYASGDVGSLICFFQCSSASRKFLNARKLPQPYRDLAAFSALQRAENSSMRIERATLYTPTPFSALQRAENSSIMTGGVDSRLDLSFSALQRAENSSMRGGVQRRARRNQALSVLFSEPKIPQMNPRRQVVLRQFRVSVLFSEPKIPQRPTLFPPPAPPADVSVLFSEPKIPQMSAVMFALKNRRSFSALQRAENSSKSGEHCKRAARPRSFSALQRAENSSNVASARASAIALRVSVLFSEPKIPQIEPRLRLLYAIPKFQCSSASRKFLKREFRAAHKS